MNDDRQARLLAIIEAHAEGATSAQVAAVLGVARRTARRDLIDSLRWDLGIQRIGCGTLARWCTANTLQAATRAREAHLARMADGVTSRDAERRRARRQRRLELREQDALLPSEWGGQPRRVIVAAAAVPPLPKCGPSCVWDLADHG